MYTENENSPRKTLRVLKNPFKPILYFPSYTENTELRKEFLLGSETVPVRINKYEICACTNIFLVFFFIYWSPTFDSSYEIRKSGNLKKDFVLIASFNLFEFLDRIMILKT